MIWRKRMTKEEMDYLLSLPTFSSKQQSVYSKKVMKYSLEEREALNRYIDEKLINGERE